METTKYATLFGGSGKDTASKEYRETILIGSFLAKRGFTIKNGGYGGMMEAVSQGARQANGKAIGITCKQVGSAEGNPFLSETIITETLYERLQLLIENTEIFIVQKGGIGTLSEVFLALDIIRKEKKELQPKVFFIGDCYTDVVLSLKQHLIPEHEHYLFTIVRNAEDLFKALPSTSN